MRSESWALWGLVLVCCMVLGEGGEVLYYDNIDGTLAANTGPNIQTGQCDNSPNSWLKLCNTTCQTCLSTDSTKCSSCSTGYTLVGTECSIDTAIYNYTYLNYFGPSLS